MSGTERQRENSIEDNRQHASLEMHEIKKRPTQGRSQDFLPRVLSNRLTHCNTELNTHAVQNYFRVCIIYEKKLFVLWLGVIRAPALAGGLMKI